jgi:two-component system, OmpR family, phosphate regulon response regulator PhoB
MSGLLSLSPSPADAAPARDIPLVVAADDDPDILNLLTLRLDRAGYEVLTARDGEQALALASERSPDLILLDVSMPKLTGLDVARRLRELPATATTPIVLLTARASESDRAAGYEAGATAYLTKPFSPQELSAQVGQLLGR